MQTTLAPGEEGRREGQLGGMTQAGAAGEVRAATAPDTGGRETAGVVGGMLGIQGVTLGPATPPLLTVPAPGKEGSRALPIVEAAEQTLTIQDQTLLLTGRGVGAVLEGVECRPRQDLCCPWEEAFL